MSYSPSIVPSVEELPAFLQDELRAVGNEFSLGLMRNVEFLTVAPAKPREGNVYGADGVSWNPGQGAGVYVYMSAGWRLLGAVRDSAVGSVAVSTALTVAHRTLVVTVSGLTVTLPATATGLVGLDWTILLSVAGTCLIQCAGADTFAAITSATETSLTLVQRGESVTFRCLGVGIWGLV